MSFFKHHMFICLNQRPNGEMSCDSTGGAKDLFDYAKDKTKGLDGVRVNKAGCLGRCDKGPVAVVYPEAVWYTIMDTEDMDEVIESHLKQGKVVDRLKLD